MQTVHRASSSEFRVCDKAVKACLEDISVSSCMTIKVTQLVDASKAQCTTRYKY